MLKKNALSARGLLALVLSATLALSGVPGAAWAEVSDGLGTGEAQGQSPDAQPDDAAAVPSGDGDAQTVPAQEPDATAAEEAPSPVFAPVPADDDADALDEEPSVAAPAPSTRTPSYGDFSIKLVSEGGSDISALGKLAVGSTVRVWAGTSEVDEYGDEEETELPDYSSIVAYQWYRGSSADYAHKPGAYSSYQAIEGATSRSYVVTADDVSSHLACRVALVGGAVKWSYCSTGKVSDGRTDLTSVSVEGDTKVGSTLNGTAKVPGSWGGEQAAGSDANVLYQWLAADAFDGSYAELSGETSAALTLSDALVGKFVKLRACSRNQVESVALGPVAARGNAQDEAVLAQAVGKLRKDGFSGYCPNPAYAGGATNLNSLIEAELSKLGYKGVTSHVDSVSWGAPAESSQKGGIDVSAGDSNGEVTFFSLDLAHRSGSTALIALRQFCPCYRLSYGTATAWYVPGRNSMLDWDVSAMRAQLESLAQGVAPSFAEGESAQAVARDFTLPNKADGVSVSWASSDKDLVTISGNSWDASSKAAVTRLSDDHEVTLTATVGFSGPGVPDLKVSKEFALTIKGDPEKVAREGAALQSLLDARYVYENVSLAKGDTKDAVSRAFNLPRPGVLFRASGLNSADYRVTYSSESSTFSINGYRANVVQPLAGSGDQTAAITCTITSKSNPEVTASKTLDFTASALDELQIDAELALMGKAKEGYAAALLDGQDASAVTGSLHAFQKGYLGADGTVAWAYSVSDAAYKNNSGIVTVELPGYDSMGSSGQARLFKSSVTSVVANESLVVTTPKYDTEVTVSSRLSSERFGSYYARYKDDTRVSQALKDKLAVLVDQDVSASFTIKGTDGVNPNVRSSMAIIGRDSFGAAEVWSAEQGYDLPQGSTVESLTLQALKDVGLRYASSTGAYGFSLGSIASPTTGQGLAWDQATGRYWQLFVNGKPSDQGASSVELKQGMSVVWYYSAYGEGLPDASSQVVTASIRVIGPDASGANSNWMSTQELSLPKGSTVADLIERALSQAGLEHAASGQGTNLYMLDSITSPDGRLLANGSDGVSKYWQLFINGRYSEVGAGGWTLRSGDGVTLYYAADSTALPQNDVDVYPDAARPDYASEWPGYKGVGARGAITAPTPTIAAKPSWQISLKSAGVTYSNVSDPLVVNGDVYVAANDTLLVFDSATGQRKASATLATSIGYTANLQYADGVILVPLDTGRLQALSALIVDEEGANPTLKTVWITDALPKASGADQQLNSKLSVQDGYVYFGTAPGDGEGGFLGCVNIRTGAVRWLVSNESSNYYWCGAATKDHDLLIADEAGTVSLLDASTGQAKGSLSLGAHVRSAVVAGPDDAFYVVGTDGTLHKLTVAGPVISEVGHVRFAESSTGTPTIVDGRVYVGGLGPDKKGVLTVIDADALSVSARVRAVADGGPLPGDVKGAPLVSRVGGETWVYFTANGKPGSLYGYRFGADSAVELYAPEEGLQEYNFFSVVADAAGNLYFHNDSGVLYKLVASDVPRGHASVDSGTASDGPAADAAGTRSFSLRGRLTAQFALRSNASQTSSGHASSLLSDLEGGVFSSSTSDGVSAIAVTGVRQPVQRSMPLWPLVGMALGMVTLPAALVVRRRKAALHGGAPQPPGASHERL